MKTAYEHPESRRDVVLSDGFVMSREEAVSKGYTVSAWPYKASSVVMRHPHRDGLVILQHGVVVAEGTAKALGYTITDHTPVAQAAPMSPHRAWRSAIITSAEAKDRPDATAELVLSQNEATMSIEAARAFLRGLPVETEQAEAQEVETVTIDPRAERLAQIKGATAAFNKSRGYAAKVKTPITPAAVSTESPEKLMRLAEIRLNAFAMNGQDRSQEAKALRLAFDAHNRVGTPFAQALAQSGFDASKLTKHAR
jgi:hypothetical protein